MRTSVYVHVTYPQGNQTSMTVDGSKALMDLRVELCSRQHLNPSLHTLELLSPEGLPLAFKPNALLGSLDLARILIKEKDVRKEGLRRPAPKIPEKTVRLVVNYHRTQKAVVRVNPLAPLVDLLPVICDKCDFNPARVLLLRDSLSGHELPLDQSLAQLGIKELYVHDQSLVLQPKMASAPALNYSGITQELCLFPACSLPRSVCVFLPPPPPPPQGLSTASVASEARPSTLGQSQSAMNLSRTSPKSDAKKRRAPAPPPTPATSSLGQCSLDGYQVTPPAAPSTAPPPAAPAPTPTPSLTSSCPSSATSSPAPSTTTGGSLTAQDSSSSSECGRSPEAESDSEVDASNVSLRSGSLSDTSVASYAPGVKRLSGADLAQRGSLVELRMNATENNRHSAVAWLHSLPCPRLPQGGGAGRSAPEDETLSLGSSSGSSSLPDQGYAASEGMGEAEDCGTAGSPWGTQPASPDKTMHGRGDGGRPLGPIKDVSSDSDEGCATWGSRHSLKDKAGSRMDAYEEDPELTAELNKTLADFDAELNAAKSRPSENAGVKASPPVGKENDLPPNTRRTPSVNGKEDVGEFPVYRPHLNTDVISAYSASVSQSKITQSSTSRFGLKTFTVVPPKHSPAAVTPQAGSTVGTAGAIKIDEQGNMVQTGVWQKPGALRAASGAVGPTSGAGGDTEERSPLLGQAKAFWSSSERQDSGEPKKTVYPASPETSRHSEQKVIILEETPGSASVPAYSYQPNPQRDLSFLRPSRRTSSQYVASAISKYAKPEGPAHGLEPLQRNVIPRASTLPSCDGDQRGGPVGPGPPRSPGPTRSMSHPDRIATETTGEAKWGGGGRLVGSSSFSRVSLNAPDTKRVSMVTTTTTTSTYPVLADRPEPSALPPAGGLFGPVKKFKKVTSKPVQQEPCLHNDLMDAIQTGGRDRLKKVRFIPSRKRPSQAEDDSERSALLSAIRATASSGRLRPVTLTPLLLMI
uniref:Cordon-bleu WH2 repeat protein n=1 Tax=Gadus morhua TaxID=8049 RepID=A0A8C5A498_GADMO